MTWSGTLKLTRNDNLGQFTENWLSFQNCRVPVLPRDLQNKTLFGEKKEFETAFWFPSCQNKKQIILLAKKKKKSTQQLNITKLYLNSTILQSVTFSGVSFLDGRSNP